MLRLRRSMLALPLVAFACGGGDDGTPSNAAAGAAGVAAAGQAGAAGSAKGGSAGAAGQPAAGKAGAAGKASAGTAGAAGQPSAGASGAAGTTAAGSAGAAGKAAAGAAGSAGATSAGAAGAAGQSGAAGKSGAAGQSGGAAGATGGAAGQSGGAGASGGGAGTAGAGGGAAVACPGLTPGPTGHLTAKTLTVKGATRGYSLDVPATLDPSRAYPLVFVLHGDGGTGEGIRGSYGFAKLAGDEAIFVYPDATPPAKSWNVDTPPPGNPDIDLFDGLLASLSASYCVDATRVFAAGMSRGGFFANRLGCDRGDKLRAIAPHSGSIYASSGAGYDNAGHVKCTTDGPAVIGFHGATDGAVPAKDGRYARDQWVFESTCSTSTAPAAPAPCVAYQGCEAAHPVVWCEVPGLAHAVWSEAPKATWAFFQSLK